MADFSEIIQEINTNLPDNTTQSITAAKLRTTLIDLTNEIDNQQDAFEEDIQGQFNTLEGQINDAVLNFESVIVDNLNSTDTDKALSAKQGNVLKETIYGTNDTSTGADILGSFLNIGAFGFKNASSGSPNSTVVYYYNSGISRARRLATTTFANLEVSKYRYLRITTNNTWYAYITFLKRDRPTTNNMTYQDLVDGGYLSKVHYDAAHVATGIANGVTKDIEIPNDAKSIIIAGRLSTDGSSTSESARIPISIYLYGEIQPDNIYYNVTVPNGYINSNMIGDGEVKTADIADGAITGDKLEADLVQKEMTGSTNEYFSFNLIDFSNLSSGYINSSGTVSSASGYYSTQFIKLDGKKVYWGQGFSKYGSTTNGAAVYDANKGLIRVFSPSSSGSYDPVENDEGAEYIRLTYTGNYTQRYVVYADSEGNNPMSGYSSITTDMINDYYRDQVINNANINISFQKSNVPELIPAYSLCGQDSKKITLETLSDWSNVGTDYPYYLKCCHTLSCKVYLSESMNGSQYIRLGIGHNSTNGKVLKITPTNAIIERYDSTNGYVSNVSYSHGLTLKDFVMCEVTFTWTGGKMRIISSGGSYVKEWNNSSYSYTGNAQVNFGLPFLENGLGYTMENVKLSGGSDRFMKPVWVCGDSYTSMFEARWTYQMINNYGIDNFLLIGFPGAQSGDILPDLKRALNYGTPKYLYWCLGMNDNAALWKYNATELECMCRERGITLIYQTIPVPTSSSATPAEKKKINQYIKSSGYRYVDGCSAVCSDDQGTWYDGMNDDGIHPTVIGAKALAGQVLVDFPEIANYK